LVIVFVFQLPAADEDFEGLIAEVVVEFVGEELDEFGVEDVVAVGRFVEFLLEFVEEFFGEVDGGDSAVRVHEVEVIPFEVVLDREDWAVTRRAVVDKRDVSGREVGLIH
jgi:hypothetical protein